MRLLCPRSAGSTPQDRDPKGWRGEGLDLLQGIAAGSIVGMPLLFTMEMWWQGMTRSPMHLLILLLLTLGATTIVCLFSGFRTTYSIHGAISEAITAMGLGLVLSAIILLLIGEVQLGSLPVAMGKIVITTTPVSLGISFANTHIRGKSRVNGDGAEEDRKGNSKASYNRLPHLPPFSRQLRQDLQEVGASLSGASLFAYNVAPTEEVIMIASRLPAWHHLLIMGASLMLCYLIIFAAGFKERRIFVHSLFQHPVVETLLAYCIALVVSIFLLWLVGVPEAMDSLATLLKCTVVLALVGAVGASAGRLVV